MATPTFIQDSRIGRTIYQVRDGALYITTTNFGRLGSERRLDLRTLNPDFQPYAVRVHALLIVPVVLMLICAAAILNLHKLSELPDGVVPGLYVWPVIWFLGSLILAIKGIPRVEYVRFNNHWGKPAVDIIQESDQRTDAAEFISSLVAHIEIAQSSLPRDAQKQLIEGLSDAIAATPTTGLDKTQWLTSIVLGGLAVALPLVPNIDEYLGGILFFVVFALSLGGTCFSVYSFIAKEPNRWWSVLGFALSLIPVFFY